MSTVKNTGPILLIIVASIVAYHVIRGKKVDLFGPKFRHHILTPSMKALRMKSKMDKELKRATGTP